MVFKSSIHIPSGGGGVTSIDGITGDITLVAGTNITITDNSPSAGDITISATGGTIGGSIAVTQVAFGSGTNAISGDPDFIYDGTYVALDTGKAFKGQYTNILGTAYINPDGSAVFGGGGVIIDNTGAATVAGFKLTSSPAVAYVLTSDAFGNGTWQAPSGGSGSPGGAEYAIQSNHPNGTFYGDATNFNYGVDGLKYQGVQIAAPQAPLHVAGVYGATVPAPASLTATLVLDPAIDSPASYSVSQVDLPATPSAPTVSLIQIDYVNAGSTSYNPAGSYVASGQTISYILYAYRMAGADIIINPTPYNLSYTDLLNDGSTFSVDFSGIASSLGNQDGFILVSSDGWSLNIGNTSSFNDNGANSGNVTYEASSYLESGTIKNVYVAQYADANASKYRGDYATSFATDANQNQYLIINVSGWGSLTSSGFIVQHNNGYYYDIGTALSYYDWGQTSGSIGDFSLFSTVAFPYFDTALTGCSSTTGSIQYGSGDLVADGSSYSVEAWEYKVYPLTGVKYFVSSGDFYNVGSDDNSGSFFYVSASTTIGSGDGRVFLLYKNGSLLSGQNISGSGNSAALQTGTPPAVTPAITGYTGTTRNFSAYGKIVTPITKYSLTSNSQAFTDNNPVGGYLLTHTLATFGNATNLKIIQAQIGTLAAGNLYDGVNTASLTQINSALGNTTVLPAQIGYLSNGSNLNVTYISRAIKTINSATVISLASPSASIVDPNDGFYYTVDIVSGTVSGATYEFTRTGDLTGSIYEGSNSSFSDISTVPWTDTPPTALTAPTPAAIFERVMFSSTSQPMVKIRNSAGFNQAFISFEATFGSVQELGRIGVGVSGNVAVQSQNGAFEVGVLGAPDVIINGNSGSIFNLRGLNSNPLQIKGSSINYLLYANPNNDYVSFGTNAYSFGTPDTSVAIQGKSGGGLTIFSVAAGATSPMLKIRDGSSGIVSGGLTAGGYGYFAQSSPGSGHVSAGAATSTNSQIILATSATLPSTPNPGGIEYQTGSFYGTDATAARLRFVQAQSSSTSTFYWRSDANGYPVADNVMQYSGGALIANQNFEPKQGITMDAGKDITMGSAARITGNILLSYVAKTASYTLGINDQLVNWTSGTVNGTLPTAVGTTGKWYRLKNSGTGIISLLTTSSQTIDGFASGVPTLSTNEFIDVESNGANWMIVGGKSYATNTTVKHLIGGTAAPTIAAGAGAGTGPTVAIAGTDLSGYITITTGTLPTLSAIIATVTFNVAYTAAAKCIIVSPANANAALLTGVSLPFVNRAGITTTTFDLTAGTTALTAATTYEFYYSISQ